MPTASQIIVPTLHHLPRCSPEVQKLELQVLWEPSTESIGVEILMSLERLKVLKFMLTMSMVPDVLPRLATLSSLTELWLSVQYMDTGDQDDEDITMPDVTFPALTKLSLQTDYMSQSNVFLRICCFPRLQELYIRVEKVESTELDSEDLATMVRLISQCCAHTVLEKINVQIDGDSSEQLFSAVSLRPLNVFRRLRILEIGADLHFLLDDNTVRDMATSWPCLEYLELWVLAPPQSLTPTTLEGLMHLAKHCPSLQTLAINVDTSRPITTPLSELDGSHCNHVLDDLSTVHSPVLGDPSEIGAVLNAIFPNLTRVNEDEIDEIRDSWRPVEEAMRKLRDGCQSEDTA
ncbi:hypothetical protein EVJ58_g753 [Rhodofomes roseus]|uniref:Uncharacterized protein n=1 Tax=Rhodofomes roseus TaxID=34475 RepID=A0A4Y9Z2X9_9APHY|nr:hypothetical protein EVJ58_g753 [Rhodofomes roseus]